MCLSRLWNGMFSVVIFVELVVWLLFCCRLVVF